MNNQPEREKNEFNNAYAYLNRINQILYMLAESKMNRNIDQTHLSLKLFFHELASEMNKEEIEEHQKTIKEIKNKIKTEYLLAQKTGNKINFEMIWDDLEEEELKIRQVMREAGLQNKIKEDWLSPEDNWE